jgi:hypothetical protein
VGVIYNYSLDSPTLLTWSGGVMFLLVGCVVPWLYSLELVLLSVLSE